ncbi:MAG: Nif3-like dinuclear metal center hexameric protein [Clostridiales bacterium]|nr:Nif3-like dinuclear metal center hexameric protein [Clostridiales bacterium]
MLTVQQVYDFINERAPFETQLPFDNSGLLVGHPDNEVTGVHFALDVTNHVIDEAIEGGANLIVTHHPLMFSPIKRLTETAHEARLLCRLIRAGISLIAAHTNLDQAPGGCNDVLAQTIGLGDIQGEGFVRVGTLPHPMTATKLAAHIGEKLGDVVRVMGDSSAMITKVGMCSGAGADEWPASAAMGAQAFLSGEVKHHIALEASDAGVVMLEAGHHATEEPGIFALAKTLQMSELGVQYNVRVSMSSAKAYQ